MKVALPVEPRAEAGAGAGKGTGVAAETPREVAAPAPVSRRKRSMKWKKFWTDGKGEESWNTL